MAVAYVCDKCAAKPVTMADVKEAVEFQGGQVIYHALRWGEAGPYIDRDVPVT